ncbi:hypothetical protein V3C99_016828 [Haemonchus contortus]|uniref:Troponin T n=1 Tax=Haemonchus contortus TaxID=6289 RepID=A0A7I4YZG8_HAECO|nr:C. briggsae CBR-TNT-4 protein [Haemonchus contortus]
MSDEEEVYSEEEVEEVEEEEEEEQEEVEEVEEEEEEEEHHVESKSAPRHVEHNDHVEDEEGLNEAEKAMLAAKRRQEEEDKAKLESYEERRKKEREAEEEELRKLKEKQERRRQEREQEELEMAERKRKDDERRKEEEEARRARQEEEKRKKEEERNKRQQMSAANFTGGQGGRNFVIPTRTEKNDKFGNIVQAKQEMGMTKEQQEEAKKVFMIGIRQSIPEASSIAADDLKAKIKELHQRICKLETSKYDLEKRHERQEYDLKELNERSRQVARNASGGKKGEQDGDGRYPPKVQVFSKYDRQIDRRNFKERRSVYENKNAYPCFPGVPPPPALFEKIFKKYEYELREEEEAEEAEEYED